MNLEPLVGAILGVFLLHESLGITALARGALIIAGAGYFSYKPASIPGRKLKGQVWTHQNSAQLPYSSL